MLAAVGLGALSLSDADAASRAGEVAISAAAFSAALLWCWVVGRRLGGDGQPGVGGRTGSPSLRAAHPTIRAAHSTDAVVATVVALAAIALAAVKLDSFLTFDETTTLIHHGLSSLGEIASTYDDPNNHVLYTLALGVVHRVSGWSMVAFRLPAFASFCLLLPAVWWFARKEFGPTAAAFATAFVGMSPLLVEYATHARGHTLLLLLFMAALLCGRSLARQPDRWALWAAWAAALALGFYTVLLMAFPALTAAAWMLLVRWREGGRAAVRPFAVKMAAWAVVAAAGTALLYAPILATEGVWGVHETLQKQIRGPYVLSSFSALLWHPFELWHAWYYNFPSGAKGVLLALVVVGAAVPGRGSKPGAGALLLAIGLATGVLLASQPFLLTPRLTLWMLPLVMTAAGIGAAFVLEQALAWAGTRWPRVAAEAGRRKAAWGATVLVAGTLGFWSAQPGLFTRSYAEGWRLRAIVSSAAPLMESGDHFATFNWLANDAVIEMREHVRVDNDAGFWFPLGQPEERWSVHRVSAWDETPAPRLPEQGAAEADGRLSVFYPRKPADTLRTFARKFVQAHPPGHELVAAFDGGMAYVLNDWVKHPWSSR